MKTKSAKLYTKNKERFDLSSYPLLDVQQALQHIGSEAVLAQMLLFMIKISLPEDLLMLQKVYAAGDWQEVQNIAHKIKGGAVYVGTVRLKMACQLLERAEHVHDAGCLESLYQQVVFVIEESKKAIGEWLQNKGRVNIFPQA
ncbi:Hpt domain-containing protein [Legionella sp. km772]|uniref:Hpt domain-containing protein n=1 Tax=Legionella sp. km772 TaxID=2498111 RepID=UPI000F8C7DF5|nr:Hpt domain-containing protein [Legionella sp. km772]RUR12463.1 Hpt domain-containing protein [Legionella sp. km772]